MNKTARNRLLWLASLLDRRATAIRKYVKRKTPARKPRVAEPERPDPADPERKQTWTGGI